MIVFAGGLLFAQDAVEVVAPEEDEIPVNGTETIDTEDSTRSAVSDVAADRSGWPRSRRIYPAPEPFSVNGYDALHAAALIRRAGLLIRGGETGARTIISVDTVETTPVGEMKSLPPLHQQRYDIVVNGEPLDWDRTYVTYGGRLLNVRLLYTYRNQRPIPDVPYTVD